MQTVPMTTASRAEAIAAMSDPQGLDVLVIGGGITGAGAALDAVTRGLRVGIVEAEDWSDGTSSRSSKLVHGGLRYLQMLDFTLVHEALTERDLMLKEIAPHLVKPVGFVFPLRHRIWQRMYIGAGIMLYDILASLSPSGRAMPWHRHFTRRGMKKRLPSIKTGAAIGGIQYWDASVDDSRWVLNVLRTAVQHGAFAASRVRVQELLKDGEIVVGARVLDRLTDRTFDIHAKHVISATGVWTEETQSMATDEGGLRVLASKGVHIVVPRSRIQGDVGTILETDKSVLFIIPWSRYWIIGTTDTPWTGNRRFPAANAADIQYVLDQANRIVSPPLNRDDILGVFAGLRPLLQPNTDVRSSAKVSREHTALSPMPGLTVIAGGKLTTYRVMARDAVDFALRGDVSAQPSVTDRVPLLGAQDLSTARSRLLLAQQTFGWSNMMVDHLLHRYGSMVTELLAAIGAQADLAKPLAAAPAYLRAEIHYAATHEGVVHLSDLMQYRTRLVYELKDGGIAALDEIISIIAPVLGWSRDRCEREVSAYSAWHRAIIQAGEAPDDASAEALLCSAVANLG